MFVKIISKKDITEDGTGKPNKTEYHESTYDCIHASIHPKLPENGQVFTHPAIYLVMDVGEQNERTIDMDCHNTELIFMNNNGKTIDRKAW